MRNRIENNLLAIFCLLSLAIAAILDVLGHKYGLNQHVDQLLEGNRVAIYSVLASLSGTLFGFAITAVSIILSFVNRKRFERLRAASSYPQLWEFFMSAIYWLGILTLASVVGLIVDGDTTPLYVFNYFMVFLLVFVMLQITTCLWLLQEMLYQASRPSISRPGGAKHTSPNLPRK